MNKRHAFAAAVGVAALMTFAVSASAQPMGGGRGPGMMRGAGPGMMIGSPDAYLDGLKTQLGITSAQDGAWNAYAAVVKQHAPQMHEARMHMFEAMNTATWAERRDMMHRAMEERQEAQTAIHAAAEKLVPSLNAAQKTKAASILPGLKPPMMGGGMMGGGMMGRGRP